MTNKQAQTAPDLALQHEVEQFLFRQSELLDKKQWQSYIDLFLPEQGMYWMPLLPSHTHWDGTRSSFV
jgi:3-phenylpropionate/cinnamic acid dioxygenase small subunit